MIKLAQDTITEEDKNALIDWLKEDNQLTMGPLTREFEREWSKWLGVKHSIFVNSGSSANLAIIYALNESVGKTANKNIIVPSVSWSTTVAPIIQLGFNPILCDCDKKNLGLDVKHLDYLCVIHKPLAIISVSVLGLIPKIKEIQEIANKHNSYLIEDTCEAPGSMCRGKKLGTFGLASSFSFYFGHHFSSIEGGMVSTNDDEFADLVKMIRSHGWSRDLSADKKKKLREKYNVSDFNDLYTFYYPGFNIRSTDLQAFIGLRQLKRLNNICVNREKNFQLFNKLINNTFWKPEANVGDFISNHAYPIISPYRGKIVDKLRENEIECRPLICGSIAKQPFWIDKYGVNSECKNANVVDKIGMYVPNHSFLSVEEIKKICEIVNEEIGR